MISEQAGWVKIGNCWLNAALTHSPGLLAVFDHGGQERQQCEISLSSGKSIMLALPMQAVIEGLNESFRRARPAQQVTHVAQSPVQQPAHIDPFFARLDAANAKADEEQQRWQAAQVRRPDAPGIDPEQAARNAEQAKRMAANAHARDLKQPV